jgi:recombinational DNA repair protein RecR
MEFSSKLLQNAVNEVAQLPGIGRRTCTSACTAFITSTRAPDESAL